jgi:hypothetical protein
MESSLLFVDFALLDSVQRDTWEFHWLHEASDVSPWDTKEVQLMSRWLILHYIRSVVNIGHCCWFFSQRVSCVCFMLSTTLVRWAMQFSFSSLSWLCAHGWSLERITSGSSSYFWSVNGCIGFCIKPFFCELGMAQGGEHVHGYLHQHILVWERKGKARRCMMSSSPSSFISVLVDNTAVVLVSV